MITKTFGTGISLFTTSSVWFHSFSPFRAGVVTSNEWVLRETAGSNFGGLFSPLQPLVVVVVEIVRWGPFNSSRLCAVLADSVLSDCPALSAVWILRAKYTGIGAGQSGPKVFQQTLRWMLYKKTRKDGQPEWIYKLGVIVYALRALWQKAEW